MLTALTVSFYVYDELYILAHLRFYRIDLTELSHQAAYMNEEFLRGKEVVYKRVSNFDFKMLAPWAEPEDRDNTKSPWSAVERGISFSYPNTDILYLKQTNKPWSD